MPGYTIKGFCSLYGVLITQLWEQAMAEQGQFYPGLALVRPSASSLISRQAAERETDHPRPSSPHPCPALQGYTRTKRATRWEDSEINYLKYLMQLSISQKTSLAKFHARFGDYRTPHAFETKLKMLRRAELAGGDEAVLLSAAAASQKPSVPPGTSEEIEFPLQLASPSQVSVRGLGSGILLHACRVQHPRT